jgi:hypothetical protein
MERLTKTLILLLVAGTPAAAPPFFAKAPDLCFTDGATTYRISPQGAAPDYRVRIAASAADPTAQALHSQIVSIALVDAVDDADFALVDDVTVDASACRSAGDVKTVGVVGKDSPADVAVDLLRDSTDADLKLFVHSARVGHRDAAALFAAMWHYQSTPPQSTSHRSTRLALFR